jgi:phosphoglycolate phosphatase
LKNQSEKVAGIADSSAVRAVLFDLDGTFADTAPDMARALNHVRALQGLPALSLNQVRPHVSRGTRGMIDVGFGIDLEESEFDALRDAFLSFYEQNVCVETRIFPGTMKLVEELERRTIAWGIVTNKATRFTLPLLRLLEIDQRAGCIVCGDTVARAKPHPDPLLHAMESLGIPPPQGLYIGDDERDVQAARAAGMRAVVALYGYLGLNTQPEDWGASALVETPGDILLYL